MRDKDTEMRLRREIISWKVCHILRNGNFRNPEWSVPMKSSCFAAPASGLLRLDSVHLVAVPSPAHKSYDLHILHTNQRSGHGDGHYAEAMDQSQGRPLHKWSHWNDYRNRKGGVRYSTGREGSLRLPVQRRFIRIDYSDPG